MAARLSFSGHETFPLRFNGLRKAVEAVKRDATVFSADDALATFGVGKNMVRSIKHWARARGVIENDPGDLFSGKGSKWNREGRRR